MAALLSAASWEPGAQATRHALVDQLNERAARSDHLDPRLHWQLAIETTARGVDREKALDHARKTLNAGSPLSTTSALLFPEATLVLVFADEPAEAEKAIKDWLAIV